jgi:hypothetical protein
MFLVLMKAFGIKRHEVIVSPDCVDHFGVSTIKDCGPDIFGYPNT